MLFRLLRNWERSPVPAFTDLGKMFIVLGLGISAIGLFLSLIGKLPGESNGLGWFGKLPGDFFIKRDHFAVYVPLGTSLIISLVGSILLWFVMRR